MIGLANKVHRALGPGLLEPPYSFVSLWLNIFNLIEPTNDNQERNMVSRKDYDCVILEKDDDGIAWVTLNRPEKRNAMSP